MVANWKCDNENCNRVFRKCDMKKPTMMEKKNFLRFLLRKLTSRGRMKRHFEPMLFFFVLLKGGSPKCECVCVCVMSEYLSLLNHSLILAEFRDKSCPAP